MELTAIVATIWAVLRAVNALLEIWPRKKLYIQNGIDFADELHANRESGFCDRASELKTYEIVVIVYKGVQGLTLKSSGTLSSSPLGAPSSASFWAGSGW